jgi:hypothetical protein
VKLRPEEITSILKQRTQHGETHGSPMSPLLLPSLRASTSWAPAGRSPAPPASTIAYTDTKEQM